MFLNNNFFSVLILILEIVLLAVTLSLDAFSVALSKGMTIKKYSFKTWGDEGEYQSAIKGKKHECQH